MNNVETQDIAFHCLLQRANHYRYSVLGRNGF